MYIQTKQKFLYSQLSDEEKRIYVDIVKSLRKLSKSVKVRTVGNNIGFHSIIWAVKEDCPEFFYVNFSAVTVTMNGLSASIYFAFYYNNIDIYWLMDELSDIASNLQVTGNIKQDEFNIHKFIVNNIDYNCSGISSDSYTIKGALIDKKAVCEGYSKAFKFLCDYAKIPCVVVTGTAIDSSGKNEKHSWNIVKINDDFFHVDCTWNRNTLENLSLSLYLNVSDNFISGNHVWQKNRYPKCNVKSNLESQIINIFDITNLKAVLNNAVSKKQRHLLLSFSFRINGTEDLMNLVNRNLSAINQFSIKSYQGSYIQELNCGVVVFDY